MDACMYLCMYLFMCTLFELWRGFFKTPRATSAIACPASLYPTSVWSEALSDAWQADWSVLEQRQFRRLRWCITDWQFLSLDHIVQNKGVIVKQTAIYGNHFDNSRLLYKSLQPTKLCKFHGLILLHFCVSSPKTAVFPTTCTCTVNCFESTWLCPKK